MGMLLHTPYTIKLYHCQKLKCWSCSHDAKNARALCNPTRMLKFNFLAWFYWVSKSCVFRNGWAFFGSIFWTMSHEMRWWRSGYWVSFFWQNEMNSVRWIVLIYFSYHIYLRYSPNQFKKNSNPRAHAVYSKNKFNDTSPLPCSSTKTRSTS